MLCRTISLLFLVFVVVIPVVVLVGVFELVVIVLVVFVVVLGVGTVNCSYGGAFYVTVGDSDFDASFRGPVAMGSLGRILVVSIGPGGWEVGAMDGRGYGRSLRRGRSVAVNSGG